MKITVTFTPEEIDLIKNADTQSVCDKKNCSLSTRSGCCGCQQQIAWERSTREMRESELWKYAVKFDEYKKKKIKLDEKIEQCKKLALSIDSEAKDLKDMGLL